VLFQKAIGTAKKFEEIVFDDDKNKNYDDDAYTCLQEKMDAANKTEMVLQVKSKADAGAKTRRAAELIRRDRYEHLPDYVGSGLADECDRIATQVEQHGRQSSGGLQRELQELIAICEKLYEDYDEDDEATLRLKAVLAWLEGREWWMNGGTATERK
jgi:hypothetical protein